jgi:glycosyltransferase involved in cell wall biosynthesis
MSAAVIVPDPQVSVVIPAFNRADCIGRAIASVQAQTMTSWELIVVDDGSTDQTAGVVSAIAGDDPRVRLVKQPNNRGAQAARNRGIAEARATWVAFLDSDDRWYPRSLERRLALARAGRFSVVHSACDMQHENGSTTPYRTTAVAGEVYGTLLQSEGPMFQTMLIRREALERIGGLDERIVAFQEWDTALSLARHHPFGYLAESTFVWDCRRGDTMSKNYLRAGRGYEQVFKKRFVDILRTAGPVAIAEHYRRAAQWYRDAGAGSDVVRCSRWACVWTALDARATARRVRDRLSRPA